MNYSNVFSRLDEDGKVLTPEELLYRVSKPHNRPDKCCSLQKVLHKTDSRFADLM